jgi:hypothetical protein
MHTMSDTYVAVLVLVLFIGGVASVLAFLRERQRWKKRLERNVPGRSRERLSEGSREV